MKTIYSKNHILRNSKTELYGGELVKPFERPERMEFIINEIKERNLGPIIEPENMNTDIIFKVHDKHYIEFLNVAWKEWIKLGLGGEAIPTVWPSRSMPSNIIPNFIEGKLGYYALANETSISEGTVEGAYEAVKVVLTATEMLENENSLFALCRPPGHHASKDQYGGYCFFNNVAIAAEKLIEKGAKKILFSMWIFIMEMEHKQFFMIDQMFILHLCMEILRKPFLIFLVMLMKKVMEQVRVTILTTQCNLEHLMQNGQEL